MSNDLNNGFEKLIRNKLEDYRTPVEPSSWDAIERSLIHRQRSKYLYIATGIVAAATALLLITLNLPDNIHQPDNTETVEVPKDSTPPEKQPDTQNTAPNIDGHTATSPNQQTPDNQTKTKQEQSVSNPASVHSATVIAVVTQAEKPDTDSTTDTDKDTDIEDPPVKDRLNIIMPRTVSKTPISISPSNKLQLPDNRHITDILNSKLADKKDNNHTPDNKKDMMAHLDRTNSKKWSVLMSFGAGNYQAPVNNRNADLITATPLLTSSNSVDYVRNKYKNDIGVPDNAGSQYGLPLSAKFIVRKDFSTRLAIESGLSYTYLSTKYRWNKNTVNQQLHYLGIPLNAVCYLVSKPGWNIYASAGGMVEKGIYAHIDRSDNIISKTRMNGLQWSVNGAAGVTYRLRKGIGLFFEPQVGYFFNNKQPESIRTESPVSFGLGAGLRFDFF
jgi:opacity protein-like surface antigen